MCYRQKPKSAIIDSLRLPLRNLFYFNQKASAIPGSIHDIHELAALLRRSPHTIKRQVRQNPGAVPAPLTLPGTRLLRWRPETVEAWLNKHAATGGQE